MLVVRITTTWSQFMTREVHFLVFSRLLVLLADRERVERDPQGEVCYTMLNTRVSIETEIFECMTYIIMGHG